MNNRTKKKNKKKSPGGINRTYGRQAAEFAVRKPSYFNPQLNKGAAHRQDAEVINNYFSPDGVNDPQGVAMGGRRRRKKTRRKMRRKTRKRRGKRGRKTRRRRGGLGFRNSPPLKGIKKPYDCSEEKKEIERLRQELALRTPPRPKRPAQAITPGSPSPRSNPFHDDYEGTPLSVPRPSPLDRLPAARTASQGRTASRLLFNNDDSPRTPADQRLRSPSPPITPKRGGRRRRRTRRTRKKRRKGGMFKKKKKKPQPRPFEEMMGFPPTAEQQRAAAVAAAKEANSYEHIPSAAEVAAQVRFSKIKPRRRTTYTEHVDAVASTIRGKRKAPERRKTMMMMTEDTITKLKKILEKTESKSSRKYLKEKIKKLEELVSGLVPEPEYTFIDYDTEGKPSAKNTHF
jgi:hypothetical protein